MESSSWESDYLNPDVDFHEFRSSSAPPPETSLLVSDNEDAQGDRHYLDSYSELHTAEDSFGHSMDGPLGRSADTIIFDSYRSESHREMPLRNHHTVNRTTAGSSQSPPMNRRFLGQYRSQSAAPSLTEQSLGPPPGLGRSDRVRHQTNISDSNLDTDPADMLFMGQRRSASTDGRQKSSQAKFGNIEGGAIRPAAKTLMDLIKEDFAEEASNRGFQNEYARGNGDFHEQQQQQRPLRSQMYNPSGNRYPEPSNDFVPNGSDNFEESVDYLHLRRGGLGNGVYQTMQTLDARHQVVRPPTNQSKMMSRDRKMPCGKSRLRNMHFQAPKSHERTNRQNLYNMHAEHVDMQTSQYEQQQIYGSQMQGRVHPQAVSPGHTIFINPTPQPYGYAAVQNLQYSHQPVPSNFSDRQQYVPIVPLQGGGGGQVQAIAPGGTYAIWQPDGQTGGQTLTILNPNGLHGVPLRVANVHETPKDGSHSSPHNMTSQNGNRNKEKGGKSSRRGGTKSGRARNQSHQTHDSLLGEFKSRKHHRDWTIREISGHVVDFCQDQNGSRFIQQRIEIGDIGEKGIVLKEVLPAVRNLRNDVFGNYVVQKLLDLGTPDMLAELYVTFQGEMLELSLQMYGCRVVQKALETLNESALLNLLPEFHNNVLSCIHDQNGNHVIQKCIQVVSDLSKLSYSNGDPETGAFLNEQIDFIVDDVLRNVTSLSCHPYGCRVFQRVLEHCVDPDKSRALDKIMMFHRTLLDDQYGNYVIQHVLQYGRHKDRDQILHFVLESGLLPLCRQKFASNVVEKLLKYGTDDQRKAVVREILMVVDESTAITTSSNTDVGCSVVLLMVRDAYANYVVQTALDVIPESQEKVQLLEELRSHSDELKSYTFAKHIVMKIEA